jgi:hypothetical protein
MAQTKTSSNSPKNTMLLQKLKSYVSSYKFFGY